jgi:uncharacterized protein (TIGR03086 family)
MDTPDPTPAAHALGALVTAADRLAAPTPCTDWTVAGLLDHLAVVAGGPPGPWDAERRAGLAVDLETMATAWRDPAAWEGVGDLDLPRATWGGIALTELVVHAWDLARTLDRPPPDLPAGLLRATLDHVAVFVPQAPFPQLWGTPVALGEDAPLWDRIVAGTGRTP